MEVYERWLKKITKKEYEIIEKCEYQQRVRKADIGKQLAAIYDSIKQKGIINYYSDLMDCTVTVSECVIYDFPNAYINKSMPKGTVITYRIEKNRIRIISACRMCTYHRIEWHFTDKAKEAIINAAQKR